MATPSIIKLKSCTCHMTTHLVILVYIEVKDYIEYIIGLL